MHILMIEDDLDLGRALLQALKAEGITSVYVVTHSWHMRRALLAFKGTGLTATAAPTDLDDPLGPDWTDFLPRTSGWQNCWFALHEWIGYAWYWLHDRGIA